MILNQPYLSQNGLDQGGTWGWGGGDTVGFYGSARVQGLGVRLRDSSYCNRAPFLRARLLRLEYACPIVIGPGIQTCLNAGTGCCY